MDPPNSRPERGLESVAWKEDVDAAYSGVSKSLDEHKSGEEKKKKGCKRGVADLKNEGTNGGDAGSTPRVKRRKVSASNATIPLHELGGHEIPIKSYADNTISQITTATNPTIDASAGANISDAESDLSTISNVSDLAPPPPKKSNPQPSLPKTHTYQTRARVAASPTPLFAPATPPPPPTKTAKKPKPNSTVPVPDTELPDPHRSNLHNALKTLEFNEAKDCPTWITGLQKPVPHAQLTCAQNLEVKIRMWDDAIERLVTIRSKLPAPDFGGSKNWEGVGEWKFDHWTRTQEVQLGRSRKKTVARGMWTWVVDQQVRGMLLDEWPRDVWGEPLGWAVKGPPGDYAGMGNEDEDEDSEGESEDEEIWEQILKGLGNGGDEAQM